MLRRGTQTRFKHWLALALSSILVATGCGGGTSISSSAPAPSPSPNLTQADVTAVVNAAASSTNVPMVIAVSDRGGNLLGLYKKANAPALGLGNFSQMVDARELALSLARTASFFSND